MTDEFLFYPRIAKATGAACQSILPSTLTSAARETDFLRCFTQENIVKTDLCAAYIENLPSNALLFYFGEKGAG